MPSPLEVSNSHSQQEHDLRNSLYVITSLSQLLRDGLAGSITARQKEFLQNIFECAGNIRQLLDSRARIGVAAPSAGAFHHAA